MHDDAMNAPYPIAITPEVSQMLAADAVVAFGVSGGKDSHAGAIRLNDFLDEIGHAGPRALIHSDLGTVEWKDSLPVSERIAQRLGLELIIVRRKAGDMMQRWETRWANSIERYISLSCVKLILPWSTPGMRFCTSEMKTQLICAELTRRYPGRQILSATGVRRQESTARSVMPVAHPQPKLSSRGANGWNWNPIMEWSAEEVFAYLAEKGETLHEAYTKYGSTRVSCAYCIMGSIGDLVASTRCPDNVEIYRRMVDLEIRSTFAFQGSRWLGDVAPHLLSDNAWRGLLEAKARAALRVAAEARLYKHLLFTAGWPNAIPTADEAALIADVRIAVGNAVELPVGLTTADAVIGRYRELLDQKNAKILLAA